MAEAAWRTLVAQKIDTRRLVFVDEMGTNTSLSPLYASEPRTEYDALGEHDG